MLNHCKSPIGSDALSVAAIRQLIVRDNACYKKNSAVIVLGCTWWLQAERS